MCVLTSFCACTRSDEGSMEGDEQWSKAFFSKVLHIVALYSRDTRVLTFEKDSAFAQGYF
jgi:hypothetical protein